MQFNAIAKLFTASKRWSRDLPDPPPPCTRCGRPVVPSSAPWGGFFLPPLCGIPADPWPDIPSAREMYGDKVELRSGLGCQGEADQRQGFDPGTRRRSVTLDDLIRAGVPRRHAGSCSDLERSMDPRLRVGGRQKNWCFVWSPERGCGKTTQLALGVAWALAEGHHARYVSHGDLLASLRPRDGLKTPARDVDFWGRQVDYLALDNLGDTRLTEWGADMTRRVIEARYDEGLPTVVASDKTPHDLAHAPTVGAAVASRIAEETGGGRKPRVVVLKYNFRYQRRAGEVTS